ncbi:hypothetical protein C2G38_2030027 [Gigaspora rosea]|uniref:Uncharacterized protein n=1 Tax=Gigaspora rosea TaxID=44941 RepID=A0A397W5Q3_9GLOM|nr:hypothetical protein C2G38_2030027 [Gigaspora rosea]CAG8692451.1 5875_t:CDS:1 [Gigaspora rosea]
MAKLHAYYVTNAHYELRQNLLENDFLKMMHDYTHLLTSGSAMFEEGIQLYDSNDDFEDNYKDSIIYNLSEIDLSEIDSNMLNIENSTNLAYALNNTNQPMILDEIIDHSETDFDIDALTSQGMQI